MPKPRAWLRAIRIAHGDLQKTVAEAVGIGDRYYSAIERGTAHTPGDVATRIADYFGFPVRWFWDDALPELLLSRDGPIGPGEEGANHG